jgi:hypothetical protein
MLIRSFVYFPFTQHLINKGFHIPSSFIKKKLKIYISYIIYYYLSLIIIKDLDLIWKFKNNRGF